MNIVFNKYLLGTYFVVVLLMCWDHSHENLLL